jgi:hypothetical protein
MSLIYIQPINDEDLWPNESTQVLHLATPPAIGDRLPLGGPRAWDVVAVDEYQIPGNGGSLYLVHCNLGAAPPREGWYQVKKYLTYSTSMQLYIGNDALLHWHMSLDGSSPKTGVLLPRYNVREHGVTAQPWGVETITQYMPTEAVEQPCYRSIWVGQCIYVPAVLETPQEALQAA